MPCELNKNHDPSCYCACCDTCSECLDEEVEVIVGKYKIVLAKIVAAHKQSTVDWDAMREAEKLLGRPVTTKIERTPIG